MSHCYKMLNHSNESSVGRNRQTENVGVIRRQTDKVAGVITVRHVINHMMSCDLPCDSNVYCCLFYEASLSNIKKFIKLLLTETTSQIQGQIQGQIQSSVGGVPNLLTL